MLDEYDYKDGFLVVDEDSSGDVQLKIFAKILGQKMYDAINKRLDEEEDMDDEDYMMEVDGETGGNVESNPESKSKTKKRKYNIDLNIPEKNYFKKLKKDEKDQIEKNNLEVVNYSKTEIPLKIKILQSNMPVSNKSIILNKIHEFHQMSERSSGYNKMKKYIHGLDKMPFGKYIEMPIKKTDSHKKINGFIKDAYKCLDDSVYGQQETKFKILQILAQWISNPNSKGSVIALQGPPGIGKTTILKNGLAKALKRPFAFVTLGGATDSSFLEGHGYTYEGSTHGRIAGILMETQCMNPIIFFDELDKISETKHGDEIVGILTHLTDSSQNTDFHDKYFAGIDIDLSRALIVFSYNDPSKINPILKDRILTINVKGFDTPDKFKIAQNYLLKDIIQNIGLDNGDIIFTEDVLKFIITTFTNEKGVRELKRCLETIILKVNLMRYTDMEIGFRIENIKFPVTLTNDDIIKLMKEKDIDPHKDLWKNMYM